MKISRRDLVLGTAAAVVASQVPAVASEEAGPLMDISSWFSDPGSAVAAVDDYHDSNVFWIATCEDDVYRLRSAVYDEDLQELVWQTDTEINIGPSATY